MAYIDRLCRKLRGATKAIDHFNSLAQGLLQLALSELALIVVPGAGELPVGGEGYDVAPHPADGDQIP